MVQHHRETPAGPILVFGNAPACEGALRVTFDGWVAKVGPIDAVPRLAERELCSLAGVLAGALAMAEVFLSFAGISIEAMRRVVALSLWRPDVDAGDPSAVGPALEALPAELWLLGLGHLGNAYAWALATLPYPGPAAAEFWLMDFDKVEAENVETGLIFSAGDIEQQKARTCSSWLEARGFKTRIIERRLDDAFRCRNDEPRLALCGFDSNAARRGLATASFMRVMESGLGGTANNFDAISVHALPNPRSAGELWPDLSAEENAKRIASQTRTADANPAYMRLGRDACGRFELAGKSVSVPFVGVAAGCMVVAEALRLLHGGPAYWDIKLRLGHPGRVAACGAETYAVQVVAGLKFCALKHITY